MPVHCPSPRHPRQRLALAPEVLAPTRSPQEHLSTNATPGKTEPWSPSHRDLTLHSGNVPSVRRDAESLVPRRLTQPQHAAMSVEAPERRRVFVQELAQPYLPQPSASHTKCVELCSGEGSPDLNIKTQQSATYTIARASNRQYSNKSRQWVALQGTPTRHASKSLAAQGKLHETCAMQRSTAGKVKSAS